MCNLHLAGQTPPSVTIIMTLKFWQNNPLIIYSVNYFKSTCCHFKASRGLQWRIIIPKCVKSCETQSVLTFVYTDLCKHLEIFTHIHKSEIQFYNFTHTFANRITPIKAIFPSVTSQNGLLRKFYHLSSSLKGQFALFEVPQYKILIYSQCTVVEDVHRSFT